MVSSLIYSSTDLLGLCHAVAPRLQVLLYADDIVVFTDSPADLQRGLMHLLAPHFRFHVGEHVLPHVSTYTCLGITLHKRWGWTQNINEPSRRGACKLAAVFHGRNQQHCHSFRGTHFLRLCVKGGPAHPDLCDLCMSTQSVT